MSVLLELDESQLVFLDIQTNFVSNTPQAFVFLKNVLWLARTAARLRVPVFSTEHNTSQRESGSAELAVVLAELQVPVSRRARFSAVQDGLLEFLRPDVQASNSNARSLPKHLRQPKPAAVRDSVILAGCQIHRGLLQTALELLEEDFQLWVVTDACSASTERNQDTALDRLAAAGVELLTTEMVVYEWLRSADHPAFEEIQTLGA